MENLDFTDQGFEKQVADALKHLWDYSYLGKHPLARLNAVRRRMHNRSEVSHVDVGRAVSDLLQAAIGNMKPTNDQGEFSRERYYHTILTKAYVEGTENKAIADSLNIGERTLYRYCTRAVQVVAQILRDWETHNDLSF